MIDFIEKHQITPEQEQEIISYIEQNVRINPTGVIDWYNMENAFCMENVSENDFLEKIQKMLQKLGSTIQNTYFILQTDDAHPPLKSKLADFFVHCSEILYHDTIFLSEGQTHLIHYDFYGNLWGKIYP